MQAGIKEQVLIDALIPDLGFNFKYGVYVREAILVLAFSILRAFNKFRMWQYPHISGLIDRL